MQGHDAASFGPGVVVGADHPPFPGGDRLGGIEAEAGKIADLADHTPFVAGGKGMGGIFDHGQAMFLGYSLDGVQVGGQTGDVDGDDGFGAGGDGRFEQIGVEVEIVGADVYQHRAGIEVTDDLGGGGEGVGGGDDLIAARQADGFQGQVHGGGAGVDGDGVFGSHCLGEFGFKLSGFGASRDPAGEQRLTDFGQFGFVYVGQGKGEKSVLIHISFHGGYGRQRDRKRATSGDKLSG